MDPITHYVGQAAHLIVDANQEATIKNVGDVPFYIGGADVDDTGKKIAPGKTAKVTGEHVYARAYTADPAAVQVDAELLVIEDEDASAQ